MCDSVGDVRDLGVAEDCAKTVRCQHCEAHAITPQRDRTGSACAKTDRCSSHILSLRHHLCRAHIPVRMRVRPPCIARHTVWREPLLHPRPRLYIAKIRAPIADDPLRGDVLDELEYAFILPDGANSGALRTMETRVLDEHVRRIGFGRDRVVAPGHVPAAQGDVVRVKGVEAVRVLCGRLLTNIMYALSGISSRVGTRRRTLLLETEWMKMSSKRRSRAVCTASDQNWLCTKRMPRIVKLVEWRMTRLMGRPAMLLVPLARSYLHVDVIYQCETRGEGRSGYG